jgi:hypothetical protein
MLDKLKHFSIETLGNTFKRLRSDLHQRYTLGFSAVRGLESDADRLFPNGWWISHWHQPDF